MGSDISLGSQAPSPPCITPLTNHHNASVLWSAWLVRQIHTCSVLKALPEHAHGNQRATRRNSKMPTKPSGQRGVRMTAASWKNITGSALQKADIVSVKQLLPPKHLAGSMGPPGLEVARAQILPHHGPRTQDIVLGASALCSGVPQAPSWKAVSVLVRLVRRKLL